MEDIPHTGSDLFAWVERLLLVAGIALFAALVWEIGVRTLWHELRAVGYGMIPIIGQEVLVYMTNTFGWRCAFPPAQRTLPFRQLLLVRFLGDVINAVTPTATVGGELIRARLLRGRIDPNAAWASIAVAVITQAVGQAAFVIAGLLIVLPSTPLPTALRLGLLLAILVFLAGLAAAVAIQRRGMLSTVARLLSRVRVTLPARILARMEALDGQIAQVYAHPSGFVLSAAAFTLGWALGTLEVYLILWFLDVPETSWHLALTIEVLSVAIDGALFFVPGKIGTQEGGKVLIFTLLGLPPAKGLALGVIRRVRDLTWSALGLMILSHRQLRPPVIPAQTRIHPATDHRDTDGFPPARE
jgi:putative membrane protein